MKTISDHMLDIVQNALEANATLIDIIVIENKIKDFYRLIINDNGCGMNTETLQTAENPFFTTRTTRRVGLGIPLLKQNVTAANGSLKLRSKENRGTCIKADFQLSHLDRPPVGDIWNSLYLLFAGNPEIHFTYNHTTDVGSFTIDSFELKNVLNDLPLQQKDISKAVIELIRYNLEEINACK